MIISDDKQMANIMANYFCSVFNKESTNLFPMSEIVLENCKI